MLPPNPSVSVPREFRLSKWLGGSIVTALALSLASQLWAEPKPAAAAAAASKPPTSSTTTKPTAPTKPASVELVVKNREGRGYIGLKSLAAFYEFQSWDVSGRSISMVRKKDEGQLRFLATIGQKRMTLGNLAFYLSFPPLAYEQEGALISLHDVSNVLDPVLRGYQRRDPAVLRTIVLDPACGGAEQGLTCEFGAEKQATLAIALKMKPLLEQSDYIVVMTRDDDSAVFTGERTRLANLVQSECIWITLRANNSEEASVRGIETSTLAPANTPSTAESGAVEPDKRYYPGNINDRESMALATTLHASLVGNTKAVDLGIKRSRDLELRGIEMPAVVCRVGLMSNPKEAKNLFSDAYQDKIAKALVGGVENYGKFLRRGLEERLDLDEKAPLKFGNPQVTHLDAKAGIPGEKVTLKMPITARLGTAVNRSKLEIQLFLFERVNGTDIDISIASPPKIEWLSVLPDWQAIDTEVFQATYDRSAMNSVEMAKLGRRNYYGFVARLIYDGMLLDEYAEPKNLNRGLYYFTPVFPRR